MIKDYRSRIKEASHTAPVDPFVFSVTKASAFPAAARKDTMVVIAEQGSVTDGGKKGRNSTGDYLI